MNKTDLVSAVASKTGLKQTETATAVDGILSAIKDALKEGSEVRLVGFGTFSVTQRSASEGRNPRTGEKIQVAASKQARFKAGKTLKDALN
jgi:DNA-binding protein HU-beta